MSWYLKLLLALCVVCHVASAKEVEVVYVGYKQDVALLGLGQGFEDAAGSGLQIKLKIESENFRPIRDPKPAAIFVAMEAEAVRIISLLNPDVPIFNLVDDSAFVRNMCLNNLVHILPGDNIRQQALSNSQLTTSATTGDLAVKAWHPHFEKGEAKSLNARFAQKRSITMSEQAWSGWLAATAFVNSYLTNPSLSGIVRIESMKNKQLLSGYWLRGPFVRSDGQVIQPLFVVSSEGKLLKQSMPAVDSTNYCKPN